MMSTTGTIDCLIGIVVAIGLFIWLIVFIFTDNDSYDYDTMSLILDLVRTLTTAKIEH